MKSGAFLEFSPEICYPILQQEDVKMTDKLSVPQERLMAMLPLSIPAKVAGYGWHWPNGVSSLTVEALVQRRLVRRKILGTGATRRMELTHQPGIPK
jgi:hypothetical protein